MLSSCLSWSYLCIFITRKAPTDIVLVDLEIHFRGFLSLISLTINISTWAFTCNELPINRKLFFYHVIAFESVNKNNCLQVSGAWEIPCVWVTSFLIKKLSCFIVYLTLIFLRIHLKMYTSFIKFTFFWYWSFKYKFKV